MVREVADSLQSDLVPVGHLVGRSLWDLGVEQVFGVVGSGNFVATSALVTAGARFVGARHEGGAVTMAGSYARVSGEPAVCSVHQGPGLTNALTGLVDAVKSRAPILLLAGQASTGAVRSNFFVDQPGLVERAGAVAEQVYRPETVLEDTTRAYRRAVVECRPVVLNMPLDVQDALVPARRAAFPGGSGLVPAPSRESVVEVAALLSSAERPLLIAGRGATSAGARAELLELGDEVGALLSNTAVANGSFGDSPWSLGIAGGFASEESAALMGEADVVVGFGCSFTTWTTRQGRLFGPDAVVVQIDADPTAIGQNARVDIGVLGGSEETARAVHAELSGGTPAASGWRTDATAQRAAHGFDRQQPSVPERRGDRLDPRELSLTVEGMLPPERTVVVDGGHFLGWPVTFWSVPDPQGFVFSSAGFQSIGLGLGAAIGAAVARPDRLTVLAAGDGGLLMSISELETLVRLDLPVLALVYNDAAYSAEVHHFDPAPEGLGLVTFPETDIAALARGAGAMGVTVRQTEDLAQVSEWLADPRGPLVVDAKIDPTVVGPWAEQDFQGH